MSEMNLPPKGLTLTQPWASLVVLGEKAWETRSWRTKYRGPIAIHAAKTLPRSAKRLAESDPYYVTTLGKYPIRWLPLGAIIGTVELVEIERVEAVVGIDIGRKEEAFGDYSPGRWAWQLANPVVFDEPMPWRGALGLWRIES